MYGKIQFWVVTCIVLFGILAPNYAMAPRPAGLAMLVIPARYSVLQVCFDLLRRREVVLVTYQGDATTQEPLLHAWNGQEWIAVPMDSYREASFLQATPARIILVGDESLLPDVLIEASSWAASVETIPAIDTPSLVNAFGSLFSFRGGDWSWFAGRYNLELADLNAERRKTSWYDQPYYKVKYGSYEEEEEGAPGGDERGAEETEFTFGVPGTMTGEDEAQAGEEDSPDADSDYDPESGVVPFDEDFDDEELPALKY